MQLASDFSSKFPNVTVNIDTVRKMQLRKASFDCIGPVEKAQMVQRTHIHGHTGKSVVTNSRDIF